MVNEVDLEIVEFQIQQLPPVGGIWTKMSNGMLGVREYL